jgi:hypothetical protein
VADFKKILDDVGAYSGDTGDGLVDLNIPRSGSASVNYPSDGLLDLNPVTGKITLPPDGFFDTPSPTPPPSDTPYSFPSIRGAAISVKDKLANISFVEGSAGEMSASIAYIRYWSRKGTQQKTAVGDTPIDGAVSDPQQQLAANFSSLSGFNPVSLSGFNPVTQNFSPSGNEFSNFSTSPLRIVKAVPTNTGYQRQSVLPTRSSPSSPLFSRPRQPVPTTTTSPRPAGPSFLNRLGSIFSANPGGAAAPPWANPFYTPAAAPAPDGAVWQFLFNPEELQLSSGPDFNRAETWGVDTAGNSGQPLSWRSNKNRKLTFGKVLLHGYTFGKRVDSLENGLQELFQARDGENGADGPPVLEFVWGQRVFGPCVIQNIQVREKAWDKGLLVNAEVSFDLEQVPEWTINDGFVDVLRPGRQSTINDPSLPGRTDTGTTGSSGDTTPPPGQKPPQTAPDTSPQTGLDPTLCNFAVQQSKIFQGLFDRADVLLSNQFLDPTLIKKRSEVESVIVAFGRAKNNFYSASQEVGQFVDSKLNNNGCIRSKYLDTLRTIDATSRGNEDQKKVQALRFAHACIRETKQYIDNWQQTSPKCKAQRVAGQLSRIESEKQAELNKQCEQIKPGKSCGFSPNLGERTLSSCNSGKTVVCIRGTWQLKYPLG